MGIGGHTVAAKNYTNLKLIIYVSKGYKKPGVYPSKGVKNSIFQKMLRTVAALASRFGGGTLFQKRFFKKNRIFKEKIAKNVKKYVNFIKN
jgi:hypothetical protein